MNAMRAWVLEGERDTETNTAVDDDVIEATDTYVARSRKHDADRELDAAFERQVARRECGA